MFSQKKKGSSLVYASKDGFRSLLRHPLTLFASVTTLFLMLVLLSAFILFAYNVLNILTLAGQQPPVEIQFKVGVSEAEINSLAKSLGSNEQVLEHQVYTPKENIDKFKKSLGKSELLKDFSAEKYIPYTMRIQLKDPSTCDLFAKDMALNPAVNKVHTESRLMAFLSGLFSKVSLISLVVFAILVVIAILIIANTVQVAAAARSEEISIMKYVGATNAHIRIPFVIEGCFAGFLAAIITSALVVWSYLKIYNSLERSSGVLDGFDLIPPQEILPLVVLASFIFAILLSSIVSAFSIRRYVKV